VLNKVSAYPHRVRSTAYMGWVFV